MKYTITFLAVSFLFINGFSQQKVSASQLEDMLNEGYVDVKSMNAHKGQTIAQNSNQKVTSAQLENMLTNGYSNVQSMNHYEGNKIQQRSQSTNRLVNSTSSAQTRTTQVSQNKALDFGVCDSKEEGKMVMVNVGQKMYQCNKAQWIRIK